MKAIAIAAVAAVLIQPVVFFGWFGIPALLTGDLVGRVSLFMALVSIAVAIPFVLLIGVPSFLLLRRFNRLTPGKLILAGFAGAAIPAAAITWPLGRYPGYSSGGSWHGFPVEYFVNGVPTVYGWLSYVEGVLMYGVHGLVGAFVFFLVWRAVSRSGHAPSAIDIEIGK
jgi:hypothetical protein